MTIRYDPRNMRMFINGIEMTDLADESSFTITVNPYTNFDHDGFPLPPPPEEDDYSVDLWKPDP